jgi:hypothetical protein
LLPWGPAALISSVDCPFHAAVTNASAGSQISRPSIFGGAIGAPQRWHVRRPISRRPPHEARRSRAGQSFKLNITIN